MASTMNQTSVIGPKNWATCCGAARLHGEQQPTRMTIVIGSTASLHARRDELQAFHRRQHGDGRSDHRIAVEEGGADHAEHQDQRCAALGHRLAERHQREGAALALVVGVEQHDHVLERDDQQQRPGRSATGCRARPRGPTRHALGGRHRLAQRVEGAGADVAVDDADRAKRQGPELLVGMPVLGAVGGGCLCHRRRLLDPATLLEWVGRGLYTPLRAWRKPDAGGRL